MFNTIPVWSVCLLYALLSFLIVHGYQSPDGNNQRHAKAHGWGCVVGTYLKEMIMWPVMYVRKLNQLTEYKDQSKSIVRKAMQIVLEEEEKQMQGDLPEHIKDIIRRIRAEHGGDVRVEVVTVGEDDEDDEEPPRGDH